ncbi:MAG: YdcH family protein [Gammaproteobacteria bacterium]
MSDTEHTSIARRLFDLEAQHRDLDEVVAHLTESARGDELLIRRLKKRKLQLKDQIAKLRSALIPDLDA